MKRHTPAELEQLARERGGTVRGINPRERALPCPGSGRCVLTLDGWLPPSLNSTMRGTIRERCRIGQDTHDLIALESRRQDVPLATGARQITMHVTYPKGHSRPDPDNIAKSTIDACKSAGLILDDRYETLELAPPVYWIGPKQTEIHFLDIPTKTPTTRGL